MNVSDVLVWTAIVSFAVFISMMMGEIVWVNVLLRREQEISAAAMKGWKRESTRLENASFQWEFPKPPEISND